MSMMIKFDAKAYTVRLKATVHSSGRLGFSADTIEYLKLTPDCSICLAQDSDNKKVLYMAILRERRDDAFPVLSAGKYVYLNTRQLFDTLKIDYVNLVNYYDLTRFEEGDAEIGGECYKMTLRNRIRTSEDRE